MVPIVLGANFFLPELLAYTFFKPHQMLTFTQSLVFSPLLPRYLANCDDPCCKTD